MKEVVIKIPDRQYELLQRVAKTERGLENLSEYGELILKGTPLPKGHGNLIDLNDLMAKMVDFCDVYGKTIEIPIIVEADMAESEDEA